MGLNHYLRLNLNGWTAGTRNQLVECKSLTSSMVPTRKIHSRNAAPMLGAVCVVAASHATCSNVPRHVNITTLPHPNSRSIHLTINLKLYLYRLYFVDALWWPRNIGLSKIPLLI